MLKLYRVKLSYINNENYINDLERNLRDNLIEKKQEKNSELLKIKENQVVQENNLVLSTNINKNDKIKNVYGNSLMRQS